MAVQRQVWRGAWHLCMTCMPPMIWPPGHSAPASHQRQPAVLPCCRSLTGRRKHRLWEPELLDPPALLGDVAVVLQSPKNPNSVGSVARSASSFECEDIRLVEPRCNHLARSARNSSKGAQYLLWRAQTYSSLQEAAADAAVTVAFTRWVQGEPCRKEYACGLGKSRS